MLLRQKEDWAQEVAAAENVRPKLNIKAYVDFYV
jgi:hypothetical protein